MTTKRTHGPCTCDPTALGIAGHLPACLALYPAQQEQDALTRLVRLIRMGPESGSIAHRDVFGVKALDLISEAREEHRKALEVREQHHARANRRERNIGLELALEEIHRAWGAAPSTPEANRLNALFERIAALKDPES